MSAGSRTSVVVVLAASLLATSCGSAEPAGEATVPPPATTTVPDVPPTTSDGATTGDAGEEGADANDGEAPVAPPEDDDQPTTDRQPLVRLSIDDALLPDDAFPAPWELQWREPDRTGYSSGPNQTDCDEYWELESLLGGDGGHAMWWIDGGNANHHVIRMADEMEILAKLLAFASLAETCPTVTWTEGGSFTVEGFEYDNAFGFRFDDAASGETTWVLVTTAGDLVSMLWMPLWTRADGTMLEFEAGELERLGTLMYEQLARAGVDESIVVTTTEPPVVPPPPVTDPPVEPDGLGVLLLGPDDLPAGWERDSVEPYEPSPTDAELVEQCPAAASIDRIDVVLDWEAEYSSALDSEAFELIGQMPDAASAEQVVRDFSTVWECDFGVLMEDATTTGGVVDLPGADVAGHLVIESPDFVGARAELVLAAIGPIVIVVSEELAPGDQGSVLDDLAPLAVERVVAGT